MAYKEIALADSKVHCKLVHLDGESIVTGVASTIIDASSEGESK